LPPLSPTRAAALGLLGIAFNLWVTLNWFLPGAATGRNDFLSFYAGATLAGTADLYDPAKIGEIQLRATGETGDSQRFIRLPCYAAFLKPISRLPYRSAYLVWELLSASALVAGFALWPGPAAQTKWLTACWTLPLFVALFNGQDNALVWFWLALSARLLRRRLPLAAGLALAMAASKYHLMAIVPIVVLAQKRWRFAAGATLGLAALLAISFAVAGWDWPRHYLAVIRDPALVPDMSHSPTLYALFPSLPYGTLLEAAVMVVLAAAVYRLSVLDKSFEGPLGIALAAGILVSLHSWLADCILLLPALMHHQDPKRARASFPAFALITPVPWFLLQLPVPLPMLTRGLMLWLVGSPLMLGGRRK
jgi:hypothetical protein